MPTAAQLCVTVALICVAFELSVSSGIEEVCAGSLFFTMIDGRNFLDKPGSREEDVEISVLQNGGRPLSPWLTLEREGKGPSTSIVLYGTPDLADVGILSLEVWSMLQKRSSRELVKTLHITVTQPPGRIYTTVKFPVVGATAYGLFQYGKISAFESLSKSLFGTKGVLVRVAPLHSTSGIEVTISPGYGVLPLPRTAREKVDDMVGHCQRQGKRPRFKTGDLFTAAGLDIDWCNVRQLIEHQGSSHSLRRNTLGLQTVAAAGNDSFITPPSYEGSNTPLVVIAIVAATAAVLVTMALAWVYFGGRRNGFYINHKRSIEQRILREKEKQFSSKVAEAQKVLMDLSQPAKPLSSDPVVAQPDVHADEITGDHESIQSLPAEPLPPYVYPRGLLQHPLAETSI